MNVIVTIRDKRDQTERTVDVGEFRAVMEKGLTIGNGADNTVVIPCEPSVKVRVFASGNQRLLEVIEGQIPVGDKVMKAGVGYPLQQTVAWDGKLNAKFSQQLRIDKYPFQLPPFELQLGEK
jgi:hypothetical protein